MCAAQLVLQGLGDRRGVGLKIILHSEKLCTFRQLSADPPQL